MYEPTAAKPEPTTPSLPGYGGLQQPSRAGKVPKPIMEKRRRARINKCLEELKVLIPDLTESGTRVDKADVLEMTVEHLTNMRNKRRNLSSNLSPHVTPYVDPHTQFKHGYQQCMAEVTKLLVSSNVDESVTSKLVEHLSSRSPPPSHCNMMTSSPGNSSMATNMSPVTTCSPAGMSPCVASRASPVSMMRASSVSPLVVPEPVRTAKLPHFAFTPLHYAQQVAPSTVFPSPPNSPVDTNSSTTPPPTTHPSSFASSASPPQLVDKTHLLSQMIDRTHLLSNLPSIARRPQRPAPTTTTAHVWRPWS